MREIKVLDCTLRDGGFVNNWNFGKGTMKNIISRLDKAGIDIIEIGFIDDRERFDPDRSIQPDTKSLKTILENTNVKKAMIVGMIDFGTCGIESIDVQDQSGIDGIRVIFKKKVYPEALEFCLRLKEKGYKIFVNPVSVTEYSDEEMFKLLDEVNKLKPMGINIVDTYGLMHKKQLLHFFKLMDDRLNKDIFIGYHSHNNFQLSYAHCIELIEVETDRTLTLDGSLYGMGKSAGNANTELITMYLNRYYNASYDMNQLAEAIDVDITREYSKKKWGYSFMYYLAALNDCHPTYVKTLIDKKTLSVKAVNEILEKLDSETRLTFNEGIIEKLYQEYQDVVVDDAGAYLSLEKEIDSRPILIIATGNSIIRQKDRVEEYIKKNNPIVITINSAARNYESDYFFFANGKRYSKFYDEVSKEGSKTKVICTSNVSEAGKKIDKVFNFSSLMMEEDLIRDNPVLILLKILIKMKVKSVSLAGFDGYSKTEEENYYKEYTKLLYRDENMVLRTELIRAKIKDFKTKIELNFITDTLYL